MEVRLSSREFARWLEARAGEGCIAGTAGQNAADLPEWFFAGQYAGRELEHALAWRRKKIPVWQGCGLAAGFCREKTGVHIAAPDAYCRLKWCEIRGRGELPPEYRLPGAALFQLNGESCHAGFLLDDGRVMEARSPAEGVHCAPLDERWNAWGLMTRYFDYGEVPQAAFLLGGRVLRVGSAGQDVRQLQEGLRLLGRECAVDGVFGPETEEKLRALQLAMDVRCDGVYDERTHDALMLRLGGISGGIRSVPDENAPLLGLFCREIPLKVLGSFGKWACVGIFGGTGWILKREL